MFQGYTALQLQFMEHVMQFPMLNVLHFNISTSRSLCAVPNMAVFWEVLHFVLFRYVAQVLCE